MENLDARQAILKKLESLNAAMPQHRNIDGQVRSLKAEIHTLNAKLVVDNPNVLASDFVQLIERGLAYW